MHIPASEHEADPPLLVHELWARLPLGQLRIVATAVVAGVAIYGLVGRRQAIVQMLQRLSPQADCERLPLARTTGRGTR